MYIDAWVNDEERLVLIERKDGQRVVKECEPEYTFFVKDDNGTFKSIFGDKLRKYNFSKRYQMYGARKKFNPSDIFESDVNHVYRYLSEYYDPEDIPDVHTAYYDIEVGYTEENKYSNQNITENPIISITVHLDWCNKTVALALCPETIEYDEARQIAEKVQSKKVSIRKNEKSNETMDFDVSVYIVPDEKTMIDLFFSICEDADVFSGWNTDGYDNKYMINRAVKLFGEQYKNKFCLFDTPVRVREFIDDKFKTEDYNYEFYGRISLDYLKLYKKYNYSEKASYKLDNIAKEELGDEKVPYPYTLDHLYKYDFEKFLDYNIKDTLLVRVLEEKLKFIYIVNLVAHNNSVRMIDPLGTVAMTEQAILNQAHSMGMYCPDRVRDDGEEETGAAGAFVVQPRKGLRRYVSGNDINSLYPSVIRALNMSPETLVAQIKPDETDKVIIERLKQPDVKSFADAWQPFFNTIEFDHVMEKDETKQLTFVFRNGDSAFLTGKQIYDMIFSSDKFCITANGTVFSREKKGVIPSLLERWYAERKQMQAEKEKYKNLKEQENLTKEQKAEYSYWYSYWDSRQQAKKINLNALYGALLNKYCRFYDKRIGQSTTLTGRSITRHMGAKINELVTGEYDHAGLATCYGDTDSISYNSKIETNKGVYTIEELFNNRDLGWSYKGLNEGVTDKEFAYVNDLKVATYDNKTSSKILDDISYIYRHKVSKDQYEIQDEYGNVINITDDHSVMIERNGDLIEVKPSEIEQDDLLIITE